MRSVADQFIHHSAALVWNKVGVQREVELMIVVFAIEFIKIAGVIRLLF